MIIPILLAAAGRLFGFCIVFMHARIKRLNDFQTSTVP